MPYTYSNGSFSITSSDKNTAGSLFNAHNSNNNLMQLNSLNNLQYLPPPPPPFFLSNQSDLIQGNPSPNNPFMDPLKAAALAAGENIFNIP